MDQDRHQPPYRVSTTVEEEYDEIIDILQAVYAQATSIRR